MGYIGKTRRERSRQRNSAPVEVTAPKNPVQTIGDKTFYWKNDRWRDSDVTAEAEKHPIKIKAFSSQYFALAAKGDSQFAKYLSLEGPILIALDGKTYLIEPAKKREISHSGGVALQVTSRQGSFLPVCAAPIARATKKKRQAKTRSPVMAAAPRPGAGALARQPKHYHEQEGARLADGPKGQQRPIDRRLQGQPRIRGAEQDDEFPQQGRVERRHGNGPSRQAD